MRLERVSREVRRFRSVELKQRPIRPDVIQLWDLLFERRFILCRVVN
jgi:hypothetical protein